LRKDLHTPSSSLNGRLVYSEPVGSIGALQATLAPGVIDSRSVHHGWEPDSAGAFSVPEATLSNTFRSVSASQSAGLGYAARRKGLRLVVNLAVQRSTLRAERILPSPLTVRQTRWDALPSFLLNQRLPDHRNLRLSWTTSTKLPNITQLQDVVDDANPLVLGVGNPELDPQYVQTFLCRYSATDPGRSRSLFLGLSYQRANHAIGLGTWTASTDTVILGVPLRRGAQLLSPVNLDLASSLNSFGSLSWPVHAFRSLVHLNT